MDPAVALLLRSAALGPATDGRVGQVLALIGMLAALVVLLRWWFAHRRR